MTDLTVPSSARSQRADAAEHWHAMTLHRGLIASVIVERETDASWNARTQLRDRSLLPLSNCWISGPFATHAAALQAGQAAAARLYAAVVGLHQVCEANRTVTSMQPPGGYQSQALQRLMGAQTAMPVPPSRTAMPLQVLEAEGVA
jgi:hypothetical protein